jgi:hypothetical protein
MMRVHMRKNASAVLAVVVLAVLAAPLFAAACGAVPMSREEALPKLRAAIQKNLSSPEEAAENSRLVEKVADDGVLNEMFRHEVEEAIGRGDPCSRHPRCAENGFEANDWFYTVGQQGEGRTGAVPIMILGFDTSGRVVRVWNLRTH